MTTEEEIKKLKKDNLRMNIVLTAALALVCIIAGIDKVIVTRLTEKTAEVAQKVGVDFQTKTNNVFGVWKSVTPR
jgi:hypothetical protein